MQDWLLILLGVAMLVGAAELLVRGAVWAALALGVSPMVVGLTVVAFGTSAPELFASLAAVTEHKPETATGNAFGSNIANIGLILGVTALIAPVRHGTATAVFEVRFLLVMAALPLIPLLLGTAVTRPEGMMLLLAMGFFTVVLVQRERRAGRPAAVATDTTQPSLGWAPVLIHVAMVVAGFIGLVYGGDFLVTGAVGVATKLGMSDNLIGVTIFAIGTSLPELAASGVAARKGHPELALGNVLGSNIFNIGMVLGAVALVEPLPMSWAVQGPVVLLGLIMAAALAALLRFGNGVNRVAATCLLLTYFAFMAFEIVRNGSL